jgi:hypothetical protein
MSSEQADEVTAEAGEVTYRRALRKRLGRMSRSGIIHAGAGFAWEGEQLRAALHVATQQLANLAAILEGVVARHGDLHFTRQQLEVEYVHGNVEMVINPTAETIVIRAKAERPKLHAVKRDEGAQIIEDAVRLANDTRLIT